MQREISTDVWLLGFRPGARPADALAEVLGMPRESALALAMRLPCAVATAPSAARARELCEQLRDRGGRAEARPSTLPPPPTPRRDGRTLPPPTADAPERARRAQTSRDEPLTFGDLVARSRTMSSRALHAMLGDRVLVGDGELRGEREWAFVTRVTAYEPSRSRDASFDATAWVLPLLKRSDRFSRTLLVGRASSNDVCIPDPSVSKLHARIDLCADGAMLLSDAGSKNGTYLRGAPLFEPESLVPGDDVRFGHLAFRCLDAATLHEALLAAGARG